jgi:hypothetical protein
VTLPDPITDVTTTAGTTLEVLGGTDPSGSDPYILRVENIILSKTSEGDILEVDVMNLITPRNTVRSKTFKIYTRDADERIINLV